MPDGEILFRAREGAYGLPYRVWEDGTSLRKAIDYPVINMGSLSPDGQWLWVYSRYTRPGENPAGAGVALPLSGGPPVRVFGPSFASWSGDRRFLFVSPEQSDRTYLIPIRIGRAWPPIPEGGFRSEEELAKLPGVRVIDTPNARPGPSADVYAFSRETVQRNLYRIPLP